ncbi:MAG: hypothetical protein ABIC19_00730 [Patescibacteria group bacterium]|nr:hypothetical protein [Patescibacteria group bacterium]
MELKLLISISCENTNQEVDAKDRLRSLLNDFRIYLKESDPKNNIFYSLLGSEDGKTKKNASQPEPFQPKFALDDLDRSALKNYDKKYTELDWEHRKIIKKIISQKQNNGSGKVSLPVQRSNKSNIPTGVNS